MTNLVCTVDDLVVGRCEAKAPGHTRDFVGTWITGSATQTIDGKDVVRENDIGVTDCGHTLLAVSSSSTGSSLDQHLHRVGDIAIVLEGGVGVSVTGVSFNMAD
jgi:hypothetical protein